MALHKNKLTEIQSQFAIDKPEPLTSFALSSGIWSSPMVIISSAHPDAEAFCFRVSLVIWEHLLVTDVHENQHVSIECLSFSVAVTKFLDQFTGEHRITFEWEGKNPSNSSYRVYGLRFPSTCTEIWLGILFLIHCFACEIINTFLLVAHA